MQLWRRQLETSFQPVALVASDSSLVEVALYSEQYASGFDDALLSLPEATKDDPSWDVLEQATEQLQRYLAGKPVAFDMPLYFAADDPPVNKTQKLQKPGAAASRLTQFQKQVLLQLARLPASEVVSYGALAELAGRPGASRAVGTAVGKNPFPIIIPCHRVLAAGNKPGGYAAGGFGPGLEWKFWLLRHEGFAFSFLPAAGTAPAPAKLT